MVYIKKPKVIHKCQLCDIEFSGTSSARFCLLCRKNRQRESGRKHMKRKRASNPEYAAKLDEKSHAYYKSHRQEILLQKQGYHIANRDRINERSKSWRKQFPEKVAANNIKLRTREPINPEDIKLAFKQCNYRCVYCDNDKKLSIEHIWPVKRGGDNHIDNLVVSCKSCNSSKLKKPLLNFIWWRNKLIQSK